MTQNRFLMHKDLRVAEIRFVDLHPERIVSILEPAHMPMGTSSSVDSIVWWLEGRHMPAERPGAAAVLERIGAASTACFAAFSRAVSFTDCYWFAAEDELSSGLCWKSVSPWGGASWTKSGQALFAGRMDFLNDISSPDFTTSGLAPKTWVLQEDGLFILKKDMKRGEGAFSEILSSLTAEILGFRNVPHFFSVTGGELCTGSPCMIPNDSAELVGLWQVAGRGSDIGAFLEEYGMKDSWDEYRTVDFLAGNPGRGAADIQIVRDPDTLRIYSLAPYPGCSTGYFTEGGQGLPSGVRPRPLDELRLRSAAERLGRELGMENIPLDGIMARAAAWNKFVQS